MLGAPAVRLAALTLTLLAMASCDNIDAAPPAEGICAGGLTTCGQSCVDLQADDDHCGTCGHACVHGATCQDGACALACERPLVLCGGSCVDLETDVSHCGSCGFGCSAGVNAEPVCHGGICSYDCSGSFSDCNGDPSDGCEVDTSQTAEHCGACGAQCLGPANGTPRCEAGECRLGTCHEHFGNCDFSTDNGCETSLRTHVSHCGGCNMPCQAGNHCIGGECTPLRDNVLVCGFVSFDVNGFLPAGAALTVSSGCIPDSNTQALMVTRNGTFSLDPSTVGTYVDEGGIVISELGNSDELFSMLFTSIAQGGFNGSCNENISTVVQHTPSDPFWLDNTFIPMNETDTGCGFSVAHFPDIVPLAGWTANTVSLAYRERGEGRLWLVEADWQDNTAQHHPVTPMLMGYMMITR